MISGKRKAYAHIMRTLCLISMAIVILLTFFMIFYVIAKGLPELVRNPRLLIESPSVRRKIDGIFPDILNTIYIVISTLLIVLPIGVGSAIYLTEYAKNKKVVSVIEFASETLSGIPSIIYGLVGMLVFVQFCSLGTSLLAGSLTLVIMNLPTIMRTTQESLKTVPQSYREGAFALGAGKWRVIRTVVLPSCINGIVTGCILTIGRILGESAALLFTAGLAHNVSSFFEAMGKSGATLTVALYVYASERGNFEVAYAIAAILIVLTIIINLITGRLARLVERRNGEK